jgi:hypothetical protein
MFFFFFFQDPKCASYPIILKDTQDERHRQFTPVHAHGPGSIEVNQGAKTIVANLVLEHLQFSETTLTNDYRLQLSSEFSLN